MNKLERVIARVPGMKIQAFEAGVRRKITKDGRRMDTVNAELFQKDLIVEENLADPAAMIMRKLVTIEQNLQLLQGVEVTQVGTKIIRGNINAD